MPSNLIDDIECENFDHYFEAFLETMSSEEKQHLPKDYLFRITRGRRVNFLTKLYILSKHKKKWVLLIEDDEGLTLEQYQDFKRKLPKKDVTIEGAELLKMSGAFVLGSRELMETFHCMNSASVGAAYNYLIKLKNTPPTKISEFREQMEYLTRMLSMYEAKKRVWAMANDLPLPEFLVLLYLYDKGHVTGSVIYKEVYKYSYSSSATNIKLGFVRLQKRGLIEKVGFKKGATLHITALGVDMVNEILSKYVLNSY